MITASQTEDDHAIAGVLLSATEEKLYGRVKAMKHGI